MNFLRNVKKLTLKNILTATFARWSMDGKDLDAQVDVLFPDGMIAINSSAKCWISKFQVDNYALLVKDNYELIEKYSLVDGDVFIGRDSNYLLFRDGSLAVKTDQLNIDCKDINITVENAVTINGVELTVVGGKLLLNGVELAVVGGNINTTSNKITTSGQA